LPLGFPDRLCCSSAAASAAARGSVGLLRSAGRPPLRCAALVACPHGAAPRPALAGRPPPSRAEQRLPLVVLRHSGDPALALDVAAHRWCRIGAGRIKGRFLFSIAGVGDDLYVVGDQSGGSPSGASGSRTC